MYINDYQKSTHSVQEAENAQDAFFFAMVGETHNEPLTREEFDKGLNWYDDDMLYTKKHIKEISETTFDEMSSYF